MKKINNRYRNNSSSNNTIYSLNYKFDSNSIAGKVSGTALDLIKRYNDLAKDAHSNNDYVTAEIFRQYAEHYRKIVTEINERKNAREQQQENEANNTSDSAIDNNAPQTDTPASEATETLSPAQPDLTTAKSKPDTPNAVAMAPETSSATTSETSVQPKPKPIKKSFHVIEISSSASENTETPVKQRRTYRKRVSTPTEETKAEA